MNYKGLNILPLVIAGLISSVCLFSPVLSIADDFKVSIIPSSDSIIYSRTIDGIKEAVNADNNNNIEINVISIDKIDSSEDTIPKDTHLLVPVGQAALEKVIENNTSYPVLATLVSRLGFNVITNKKNTDIKTLNIGAVFLDQPLERQLSFTRLALPNNKRLGFLMGKEYRKLLTEFESITRKYPHHIEIYNKGDNLIKYLNRVINNADVIIALPDTTVFNRRNTHNILLSSYRKFIPLVGFSASYVKAGALTGIHSTPGLIGQQTGELINTISSNGASTQLPKLDAKYFQISVNNKVARSLGLPPLDENYLRQKLLEKEKTSHD